MVIDDAIGEIDARPAVNILQGRELTIEVSKAVRARDGINDDDLFIGVSDCSKKCHKFIREIKHSNYVVCPSRKQIKWLEKNEWKKEQ